MFSQGKGSLTFENAVNFLNKVGKRVKKNYVDCFVYY